MLPQHPFPLPYINHFSSPKFTIALMHTPRQSPYHARFLVPLNFSKFDIKDYLYHAYSIKCFNIRSYVKLQPVRDSVSQPFHWFRPESKKYMTVEMERPFVWPEQPEDWEPWGKKDLERREKEGLEQVRPSAEQKRKVAERLRGQAEEILRRKEKSLGSWERVRPGQLVHANEPKYRLRV